MLLPSYMHASVILSLSSPHCLLSTDHLSLSLSLQMLSLQITPSTSFYPPTPTYYCHILSLNWKHFGNTYCETLLFWHCTPVIAICLFCDFTKHWQMHVLIGKLGNNYFTSCQCACANPTSTHLSEWPHSTINTI